MIKKRNLDPSLIQWIMSQTGLGPGIGELHWVAPASSATSQFRTQLQRWGVEQNYVIHTTIAAAEAKMVAYRNDVMMVMPGAYLETAELDWDKANTHMLGLGGPNTGGDWSEPNVVMYTSGVTVAHTLHITGQNCQFQNVTVENYGNNAACLAAVYLDKYGCTFKNVNMHGNMTTNQCTTAAAASLYIGGAGMYPLFEDCQIGQDVWGTRSGANSAQLRLVSAGRPNGATFRRCKLLSRSVTATCALVSVPVATYIGRSWYFDNCHFSNFYDETTLLNQVFYTVTGTQKFTIQLHNCSAAGYTEWQQGDFDVVVADMPITATAGGLMKAPTGTVGN